MRCWKGLAGWAVGGGGWLVWVWGVSALGQQMTIGAPFSTVREGFFEHIGVQWALQGRNWFAQFGGADLARPTIGGFQPGAGIQGGFGFGGPGWSGQLQFAAGQGNTRTFTSGSPSVTVMNGATGYVADVSLSPFVIGLIPVVGTGGLSPWVGTVPGIRVAGPQMPLPWNPVPGSSKAARFLAEGSSTTPPGGANAAPQVGSTRPATPARDPSETRLAEARQSSAGQAAPSVAEAKALRQAEIHQANQEAQEWFQRGQQAEQEGKPKVAIIYYRMAAQRASGELKQQSLARLAALQSASSP